MKFEATIYNDEVRSLVEQMEHHKHLTDDWADPHYIEVEAENEDAAKKVVARRYPAHQGFVLMDLTPLRVFEL